jgi:5S rRNA maturation endonuclease (ribonuclease M5)
LLQNLDDVKQVGQTGEYQANCPLCNDTGQHLYFKQENALILMHCHHGCDNKFILLKLGLTQANLFQSNGSQPGTPPPAQHVVAEYVYTDEQGQPLHKTVKMGPVKRFFQKHWDGQRWVNGLGNCRRVLYNLQDLDNAKTGDLVYLCEGEKSADAIRKLGPLATTNAMGAGHWRPEYSEMLRGRRVVILPDFDDAGIQHMQTVNRELTGKATSVQVLILPGLKYNPKHGGDPWDWVDRGGTINELYKLTITAPRLQVQAKKATAHDYMTALAILGYHFRINTCTDYVEVTALGFWRPTLQTSAGCSLCSSNAG